MNESEKRQKLGTELARHREAAGLTQTAVAAKMMTSASVISHLEGGDDVKVSTIERYLAAIGLEAALTLTK